MSDEVDELRLRETTDARVWAEEFAKVRPDVDRGLMIGWFANAIETGRDAGFRASTGQRPLGPGARVTREWISDAPEGS